MQLHLGYDHTKFTQDRPPVQSDILFPRAIWPLSLPEKDCQHTSIRLLLHMLAISVINSYRPTIIPITF